jgi:hypothetical protein
MKVTSKMALNTVTVQVTEAGKRMGIDSMQYLGRLEPIEYPEGMTRKERDRLRTSLQAPISAPKYRVMYLKNGREYKSAWLYNEERAVQGLRAMQAKYGDRSAIIFVD